MMAKINTVLEGKWKGKDINNIGRINGMPISKLYVDSCTVINEDNKSKYSFWRGALGVAVFGGLGVVAGLGGKKKEYMIAVEWKTGEKSLIYVNEDRYKQILKMMF